MGTIQGFGYSAGPPVTCGCGRRFQPSHVIERRGGTKRTQISKCPTCTKDDKRTKRLRKQQN